MEEEASSQAKGTNSTSFLAHVCVRNEVELVPLACEDEEEEEEEEDKDGG